MTWLAPGTCSEIAARAALLTVAVAVRGNGADPLHRGVQALSCSAVFFPVFVRCSDSMPRTTGAALSAVGFLFPAHRRAARVLRAAVRFPFSRLIQPLLRALARGGLWLAERRSRRCLTSGRRA